MTLGPELQAEVFEQVCKSVAGLDTRFGTFMRHHEIAAPDTRFVSAQPLLVGRTRCQFQDGAFLVMLPAKGNPSASQLAWVYGRTEPQRCPHAFAASNGDEAGRYAERAAPWLAQHIRARLNLAQLEAVV